MGTTEFRELKDEEDFDPSQIAEVPFTQAKFYGEWQKALHRNVRRFLAEDASGPRAYFQIINYPLFRKKRYLYIPYGPVVRDADDEILNKFSNLLRRISKEENAAFVRLDFTPTISDELLGRYFKKSPQATYHGAYFQPRVEWYLSIEKSSDALLADMHEKTRYSIRVAERKDVVTEIIEHDFMMHFDTFYRLMKETSTRDHFSLHYEAYYRSIFESMEHIPHAYLAVAYFDRTPLAMNLVIPYGGVATYVFGATADTERNRMPAYAAQWVAILHAKEIGCHTYNFGGITSTEYREPGWEGLTRFKKRFGGKEMLHSNFYDVIADPFWYSLYILRKGIKDFLKQ